MPDRQSPLKFRCHGCSQLLGVARPRAGRLTRCPKCGVELIIPLPDAPSLSDEPDVASAVVPRVASEPVTVPFELGEFSPEDARILAGSDADFLRIAIDPTPEYRADHTERLQEPKMIASPIAISRDPVGQSRALRGRDVVLPRSLLLSWMIFALLGLGFAFLSGYLVGKIGLPAIEIRRPSLTTPAERP
jgi:DNA-directed RNA polymerase subunit RPC12/RpoP